MTATDTASVLAPLSAAELAITRHMLSGACGQLKQLVDAPDVLAELAGLHAETGDLLPESRWMMLHSQTDAAYGELYALTHRPHPLAGKKVWTHWHNRIDDRLSVLHHSEAIVLRATPDGIVVREVGYGSRPEDVFTLQPEDIRSGAECSECITA